MTMGKLKYVKDELCPEDCGSERRGRQKKKGTSKFMEITKMLFQDGRENRSQEIRCLNLLLRKRKTKC